MALITFEDANSALGSKFPSLWNVVTGAWDDYANFIPENVKALASPRSRASLVHDFMVQRSLTLAETELGVSCLKHRLMFVLVFETQKGYIAMRLKKLNEYGFSKNNPTRQVDDFKNQVEIAGIDAKHHLEVGYVLNPLQTGIQSVELVCPSGDGVYWMADMSPTQAKENLYNLWEHKGEEEQQSTGFTVKRRIIGNEDEDKSSNAG